MLTALGATLTVLLSLQLNQMLHGPWRALAESIGATQDVSRFGAEAAKGIGFLGAGTIIITARQQVKGLTTAAGLWASACLGLAIGAGFYACAFISMLFMIACMYALPPLERRMTRRAHHMNISLEIESMEKLGTVVGHLRAQGVRILTSRSTAAVRPRCRTSCASSAPCCRPARPSRAAGRAVGARRRDPHRRDLRKEAVPCCTVLTPSAP